jgi:hypothetical protein
MKRIISTLIAASLFSAGNALAGVRGDVRATFDRFIRAQNSHDVPAVRDLLWDSPNFLWITRGTPTWGRDAAIKRFETLYQGTWKLSPDASRLKVIALSDTTAQLFVPVVFNIGPPGQPAQDAPFFIIQTFVKGATGWRITSILPIPVPPSESVPAK